MFERFYTLCAFSNDNLTILPRAIRIFNRLFNLCTLDWQTFCSFCFMYKVIIYIKCSKLLQISTIKWIGNLKRAAKENAYTECEKLNTDIELNNWTIVIIASLHFYLVHYSLYNYTVSRTSIYEVNLIHYYACLGLHSQFTLNNRFTTLKHW